SPGLYNAPLLLLVLTLGLSTFTASLAQTLDRHLSDQVYYQTGSDIRLLEFGNLESAASPGKASSGTTVKESQQAAGSQWFFLPVSEHLRISGVQSAARVGNYTASLWVSQDAVTGRYLGIDRTDFPQAAFWRSDFAAESLGALMNALALAPEGVLLPRAFMESQALRPGDSFHITVHTYGVSSEYDARIVGGFDYFPNWYPGDGPLVVGNLDYLFERAGGEYPYEVWLKTKPGANVPEIISKVRQIDKSLMDWKAAQPQIAEDQVKPERQGLFGLLSIGFAAAALLTVLGFLLYAFFSFQRRFIELGVLRAIGLSSGQMMVFLASELAFLLGAGLAAGTGLGVLVSNLFIPYLQVGATDTARIPPFLVQIDWMSIFQMYILFGLLFIIALTALAVFLLRMKIFQAVKLGEAV
ncbi:MAG: ABC transporter permease, partial [Omnitrophica WOR_2 bacterium]